MARRIAAYLKDLIEKVHHLPDSFEGGIVTQPQERHDEVRDGSVRRIRESIEDGNGMVCGVIKCAEN